MKRFFLILLTFALLLNVSSVFAEDWTCPSCNNQATGNFCSNCGTAKPDNGKWVCSSCGSDALGNFCANCGVSRATSSSNGTAVTPQSGSTTENSIIAETVYVKNYLGLTVDSCGYTSMGGDRRDYCGSTNYLLALVAQDGTFVDPKNKKELQEYYVIAQYPSANTEFIITSDPNYSNSTNKGYDEIILVVSKNPNDSIDISFDSIIPSPSKEVHYVRDYVGKNLYTVGYTSWGGERFDEYGPKGRIKLELVDGEGYAIDPSKTADLKYYVVTKQSVMPNTECRFTYTINSAGNYSVSSQSISTIRLTAAMSNVGLAEKTALEEEQSRLKASGLLTEIHKGTYEIGVDLKAGNYIFTALDQTEGTDIYIYADKKALRNDDGEWGYLYGEEDKEYFYMKEGMFIKVESGSVNALFSSFDTSGDVFELFEGTYHIGKDLLAGDYELTQISSSCDVNLYQNESAYANNDYDWDFLYGEDDYERYALKEGMILSISDGAAKVTKK